MKRTTTLSRPRSPAKSKPPRTPVSQPLDRYLRAVNYLAAAQVYLQANPLLEKPLRPEHIRERLLGHWGTCPGIRRSQRCLGIPRKLGEGSRAKAKAKGDMS